MNKEEMMSQIAKMECEINHLKKELNKQEKPSRRWKPEFHDKYYYIDSAGVVNVGYWDDYRIDKIRYAIGNIYRTEEEAKFAVEQLKILAELKEYADDDKEWNNRNNHWSIQYTALSGHIEVDFYSNTLSVPFNLYFSSPEQAQKAIDAIGEERLKKYYFCVEE